MRNMLKVMTLLSSFLGGENDDREGGSDEDLNFTTLIRIFCFCGY